MRDFLLSAGNLIIRHTTVMSNIYPAVCANLGWIFLNLKHFINNTIHWSIEKIISISINQESDHKLQPQVKSYLSRQKYSIINAACVIQAAQNTKDYEIVRNWNCEQRRLTECCSTCEARRQSKPGQGLAVNRVWFTHWQEQHYPTPFLWAVAIGTSQGEVFWSLQGNRYRFDIGVICCTSDYRTLELHLYFCHLYLPLSITVKETM